MTDPSAATPAGSSVIHDLGYRPYTGPAARPGRDRPRPDRHRLPQRLRARSVREVEGAALRRCSPSTCCRPSSSVACMVFVGLDELPIGYAQYASTTQVLLGIFVASQAPVLFSRDLRHGTISLYLARPLRSSTYAVARWVVAARCDPGLPAAADPHPLRRGAAR